MSNLIPHALSNLFSFVKALKVKQFFALLLAGVLAFSFSVQAANAEESLGEKIRDRMEQADRNSDRPKTTGEFKDEVSGDVPLGERLENTVRDSAEAFKQFGKEYSVGAEESARNVKEKAAETADRATDRVR